MSAGTEPIDLKPPAAAELGPNEADPGPSWRKILLLAIVVVVLLTIAYESPLRQYLGQLQELSQRVRAFGILAPLVVTLSVALLVAIGFPRLLFCLISGMALGFWSGLLWAQLGTLIGNYALFIFARQGGGDWARRFLANRTRLNSVLQQPGIPGVILARQIPLPGVVINLACGLLAVRHRDFLIGTIVGQLPQAIPCTLIGAGALQASFAESFGLISLAAAVAVLAWLALRYALRRLCAQSPSAP